MAFTFGLVRSICSRYALITSTHETLRECMALLRTVASMRTISLARPSAACPGAAYTAAPMVAPAARPRISRRVQGDQRGGEQQIVAEQCRLQIVDAGVPHRHATAHCQAARERRAQFCSVRPGDSIQPLQINRIVDVRVFVDFLRANLVGGGEGQRQAQHRVNQSLTPWPLAILGPLRHNSKLAFRAKNADASRKPTNNLTGSSAFVRRR